MSVLPWRQPPATPTPGPHAAGLPAPAEAPAVRADPRALTREFFAYRQGQLDGRPHSVEEAAERFGLDLAFARTVDAYLTARQRLRVSRVGWRAGLPRGC
jgi:hypothetical protein